MRLIDADALCAKLQKEFGSPEGHGKLMKVNYIITHSLTIDAEPVRHGIWVEDDEGRGNVCGLCGWYVYEGDRDNYCPHCGAKMDGEE